MTDETKPAKIEEDVENEDDGEFKFVEDPSFQIEYKGDCAYEVKVSVPIANASKETESMYEEIRDETELPGFRRGRAPIKLVEKKFSKAVKNDVQAKLVSAAFEKLIKDEDLSPLDMPDIDGLDEDTAPAEGGPLEFTFKFEVGPKVELGKYRGVEVDRPLVTVDDEDVIETIDEFRSSLAMYEGLEGEAAEDGDQVVIDFAGTIDGEPFEGGSAENFPYIIGSGRFLPAFEKVLLGASPEDTVKAKVTFPDDYFKKDLRGSKAVFQITVHEVKRKVVPDLTDEFAQQAGYGDVKDMKTKVTEKLRENSSGQSKRIAESRALQKIIEISTFEIPPSMIENVAADHYAQRRKELVDQGLSTDQIEEQRDELMEKTRESARDYIKSIVALQEIGKAEGVEVTEEDFEKEAEKMSQSMGVESRAIAQYIAQSEERSAYVDKIFRAKTLAIIMDNAKITDKELSREEMDQESAKQDD